MKKEYSCLFCGFEFLCREDVFISCSRNDHFFSLYKTNNLVSSIYFVQRKNFSWVSKLLTENSALYKLQILNGEEFTTILDPKIHYDISEKYLKNNLDQDYIIKTINKINNLALFL